MESLFIEIDSKVFQTPSNIIIGIVYRMPDSSIDIFNDRYLELLANITWPRVRNFTYLWHYLIIAMYIENYT